MSGVLPVIVTSNVDATRPCDRSSTVDRITVRPAPDHVLGECDVPPRRLRKGRMKHVIHQAVADGRLSTVRLLVDKLGESVDAVDVYGRTPLMLASLIHNEPTGDAIVRFLLSRRAKANVTDSHGRSALHYACLGNKPSIVARLLADPRFLCARDTDSYGFTSLMYAAMRRHSTAVIRSLIAAGYEGGSVDERDALGYTALMLAVRCHNFAEAAVLLDDGHASTTLRDDEYHRTAVEWAEQSTPASYRQQRTSRGAQSACDMYARLKPFRCRHRPAGELATSCVYHVTRGVPEQFRRSTTDMQLAEDAVSRDRLTTALKHAQQRKMEAAKRHGGGGVLAAPLMQLGRIDDVSPSASASILPAPSAVSTAAAGASPHGPPTPLLRAIGPSTALMAPDMRTLFSLYYHDQTVKAPEPSKTVNTSVV